VGADAAFLAVVDRAQAEDVLLVAPAALDLLELFAVETDLVGAEIVVRGGDEELAGKYRPGTRINSEASAAADTAGMPSTVSAGQASSTRMTGRGCRARCGRSGPEGVGGGDGLRDDRLHRSAGDRAWWPRRRTAALLLALPVGDKTISEGRGDPTVVSK
jgi:hypothetical protein